MRHPRFIDIDGRRYVWRDILDLRRRQIEEAAKARQPALFELRHDCRPAADRTAGGRYLEPGLFARIEDESQ